MVDNKVVEIMWLENKFRKTSHDWATKLVAAGAGSEDLNIGSDCNIKYGKKNAPYETATDLCKWGRNCSKYVYRFFPYSFRFT